MTLSISDKITAIRRERGKDLAILAHHYQCDAVVGHADILGDSLELSRKIAALSAKDIMFCGVFFMAETAAMLAAPGQRIHIPMPGAVESLNVGAAAAICLFETLRRRLPA